MSNNPKQDDEHSPSAGELANSLVLVRSYLERFYQDEPNDDAASRAALEAVGPIWRERWSMAEAFKRVLEGAFQDGTMMDLVTRHANRSATSDEEARQYLRKVFSLSALDIAVNYDELV
jgi:hypothetical protein